MVKKLLFCLTTIQNTQIDCEQNAEFSVLNLVVPRAVTEKKNSPLQPMQVVQGRSNGYPVPRSIAEPPCPGGYKYGGLVLQVGGWATGRQPVAVKKLTVRKHKLWPRNRWSGIDLAVENV